LKDLASAIELLRDSWNAGAIVSAGLCSGAYHSFKAAVAHYPVAQVVLINPLTFFWKPGMSLQYPDYHVAQEMQRYRRTMLSASSWQKLMSGRVDLANLARLLMRAAAARLAGPVRSLARWIGRPLEDDPPTEMRRVARAAIDLQFIFSAGDPGLRLLQTQAGATTRSLQNRGQLGIALVERANHTFTDLPTRRKLLQVLVARLDARTQERPDEA
jgi:hypothetical protein